VLVLVVIAPTPLASALMIAARRNASFCTSALRPLIGVWPLYAWLSPASLLAPAVRGFVPQLGVQQVILYGAP